MDRSAFDRVIQADGFVSGEYGRRPGWQRFRLPKPGFEQGDGRGRVHRLRPSAWRHVRTLAAMLFTAAKVCSRSCRKGRSRRLLACARWLSRWIKKDSATARFSLRVRGGLSQGDQRRFHRQDEPGVLAGGGCAACRGFSRRWGIGPRFGHNSNTTGSRTPSFPSSELVIFCRFVGRR